MIGSLLVLPIKHIHRGKVVRDYSKSCDTGFISCSNFKYWRTKASSFILTGWGSCVRHPWSTPEFPRCGGDPIWWPFTTSKILHVTSVLLLQRVDRGNCETIMPRNNCVYHTFLCSNCTFALNCDDLLCARGSIHKNDDSLLRIIVVVIAYLWIYWHFSASNLSSSSVEYVGSRLNID